MMQLQKHSGMAVAILLALFPAAALPVPGAQAHGYKLGSLGIGHLWSPPSEDGAVSVYGPFLNTGAKADRLVAASSPVAEKAQFCAPQKQGGKCQPAIELAPGKPYAMAPWRAAIRLTGLKRRLEKGQSFDLTLTFERAGKIGVKVIVQDKPGH